MLLAMTPDAMVPSQQLALALRQQATPLWTACQTSFDVWRGRVQLELDIEAGAIEGQELSLNTTEDRRFGKCVLRKLSDLDLPKSYSGSVQLHLNLVDRALDARVDGGHWEHWSLDGAPPVDWAEYPWRPEEGRYWGTGNWISFHENLRRVEDDLDACWLQQQAFDPYVAGRVDLLIRVRGSQARSVEVLNNTAGAQELALCFSEIFEGAFYPPDLDGLALYPVIRKPPPGMELRLGQFDSLVGYLGYHCRGPEDDETPAHRVDARVAFTVRKGEVQAVAPLAGSEADLGCLQERVARFNFRQDTSGRFVVSVPLVYGGERAPDREVPEPLGRTVAAVYGRLEACIPEGSRPDGRVDFVITLAPGGPAEVEVARDGTGVPELAPCFTAVLTEAPWPQLEGRWLYPFFFDFQ